MMKTSQRSLWRQALRGVSLLVQSCGCGILASLLPRDDKEMPLTPGGCWAIAAEVRDLVWPLLSHPSTRSRPKAFMLIMEIIGCVVFETFALLQVCSFHSVFVAELQGQDSKGYVSALNFLAASAAGVAMLQAYARIVAMHLSTTWRAALTRRLAQGYLANAGDGYSALYQLQCSGVVENPDQRVCQDVSEFCRETLNISVDLLRMLLNIIGFASIVGMIFPAACANILILVVLRVVVAGAFLPSLVNSQGRLQKAEASMRSSLQRVRENAESISFLHGGQTEMQRFLLEFGEVHSLTSLSINPAVAYELCQMALSWVTVVLFTGMFGSAWAQGEVDLGEVVQAAVATGVMAVNLKLELPKLEQLCSYVAAVKRLSALDQALQKEALKAAQPRFGLETQAGGSYVSLKVIGKDLGTLRMDSLTLRTPASSPQPQRTLVEDLSLHITLDESLLITGDPAIGKTSLLRAFAGLWYDGCGVIERCARDRVVFLPQRPYMCVGTLRDQLLYPQVRRHHLQDSALRQALADVNLEYILHCHSLHDEKDWGNILSLAEQQRLSFARLLLAHNLELAVLDEATSMLDEESEAQLYELLQKRVRTYISAGQRATLRQHHSHVLWLQQRDYMTETAGDRGYMLPASAVLQMSDFDDIHISFSKL